MGITLRTEDGKRVIVDIFKDECIYDAPHNPPNTGSTYTRGTDLHAHVAKSGTTYYYLYHWSMWQGEDSERFELLTTGEAQDFCERLLGLAGVAAPSQVEEQRVLKHFPELTEEDA